MNYQLDQELIYKTAKHNGIDVNKLGEIYLYQASSTIKDFYQAKEALRLVIKYQADRLAPVFFQRAISLSNQNQFKELEYFLPIIKTLESNETLVPYFVKKIKYCESLVEIKVICQKIRQYELTSSEINTLIIEKSSQLLEKIIEDFHTLEEAMKYQDYDLNQRVRSLLDTKIDTLGSRMIDQCQSIAAISNVFNRLPESLENKAIQKWSSFSQKEIDHAITIDQMLKAYSNTPPKSQIRKIAFDKLMTMLQDTLPQLDSPSLFKELYESQHNEEIKKLILQKWVEKSEILVEKANGLEKIKKAKTNLPPNNPELKDKAYSKWSLFFQDELDRARNLEECLDLARSTPLHDLSAEKLKTKTYFFLDEEINKTTTLSQCDDLLLLFKGNRMFIVAASRIIKNKKRKIILQEIEEKQDLALFFNYYHESPSYYSFNDIEISDCQIEYFTKLIEQLFVSNIDQINDLTVLKNLFECSLISNLDQKTIIFKKIYQLNCQ